MKLYILIILKTLFYTNCIGQSKLERFDESDWALNIQSPSKDSLHSWCSISSDSLKRIQKNKTNYCDLYYYKDNLYSGWACLIISNNQHKFRYEKFIDGKMVWRIAYYDNGQIDGDFRLKDCKNYGPSRMWLYGGGMYIDEYYSSPGVKDGVHKRWHDNDTLAKEAKYENGKLIYEKRFDRTGKLIHRTKN